MAPCWYDAEATKFALPVAVIAASPDNRGNMATCARRSRGVRNGYWSCQRARMQPAKCLLVHCRFALLGCEPTCGPAAYIRLVGQVKTTAYYISSYHTTPEPTGTSTQESKKDLRYGQQDNYPECKTPFARLAMYGTN